jgi:glycosyltransferase involved in cell wall biosynthesis
MHLLRLLNQFDRSRFAPIVALARPGGSYESDLAPDIPVVHLTNGMIGAKSSSVSMLRSMKPLRSLVQRIRPDIVFSLLDHASLAAVAATAWLAPRPRLVLSVQNPPLRAARGSWHPVEQLVLRGIPKAFSAADAVIAISAGVADDLLTLCPALRDRLEVVPNAGWDDQVQDRARESLPASLPQPVGPLLVSCGRLTRQKGYPHLIAAVGRLRVRFPGLMLWILGEGPERSSIEATIRRLDLNEHVKLLGFQDNPYRFMAAADVFVLASLWEGFGNVIVEAMAVGTPVVVTACEGPREIIRDGIDGILAEPGSTESLADRLEHVLGDAKLRRNLAGEGRARAAAFHSTSVTRRHEALFERVCVRSAAPLAVGQSSV